MTRPATTLVIVGAKGGVGKTTTSLTLGGAVAANGYSAVAIELDIGMANFVDFLDIDADLNENPTLHDVFADDAAIESACYRVMDGFDIGVSGTNLTGYSGTSLERLPAVVEQLQAQYDLVLLDTPAGLNEETVRSLQVADRAILVSTPRIASVRNVRNTIELAERVETPVEGLVVTKSGTGAAPTADRIADFLDTDLLGHVPEDDAVPYAQDSGEPLTQYAPRSGAAVAYGRIASILIDDLIREDREAGAASTHLDGAFDGEHQQSTDTADPEHARETAAEGWNWVGERDGSDSGDDATESDHGDEVVLAGDAPERETVPSDSRETEEETDAVANDRSTQSEQTPTAGTETEQTEGPGDTQTQQMSSFEQESGDAIRHEEKQSDTRGKQDTTTTPTETADEGRGETEMDDDTDSAKTDDTTVSGRIRSLLGL